MNKTTKNVLTIAIVGVAGYLLYNNTRKKSFTGVPGKRVKSMVGMSGPKPTGSGLPSPKDLPNQEPRGGGYGYGSNGNYGYGSTNNYGYGPSGPSGGATTGSGGNYGYGPRGNYGYGPRGDYGYGRSFTGVPGSRKRNITDRVNVQSSNWLRNANGAPASFYNVKSTNW